GNVISSAVMHCKPCVMVMAQDTNWWAWCWKAVASCGPARPYVLPVRKSVMRRRRQASLPAAVLLRRSVVPSHWRVCRLIVAPPSKSTCDASGWLRVSYRILLYARANRPSKTSLPRAMPDQQRGIPMSEIPSDRQYAKSHEWIQRDGDQ